MRIGILTFHSSTNNGALIQCYALSQRLKKDFPNADVEVIDYVMPKVQWLLYPETIMQYFHVSSFHQFIHRVKVLVLDPGLLKRQKTKNRIFAVARKRLPLSKKKIESNDTKQLFEYMNDHYDIVVAGSDAIWNYSLRGFPNPYFLDNSLRPVCMSYAASCYGMPYETIPDYQKQRISEILNSYKFVGVRDAESEKFVAYMGASCQPQHTCDPTILLDMNNLPIDMNVFMTKLREKGYCFEKQSIGVMGDKSMCEMVRNIYGNQYQIISLFNYCKSADVNLYDIDPYEWAYIFRLFKLTFTSYFHGTLLSLKNKTPVICIASDNPFNQNHCSKVKDFLCRVGLDDCYFEMDYKELNLTKIKSKADALLAYDNKAFIANSLKKEEMTYQSFFIHIKSIVECEKMQEEK